MSNLTRAMMMGAAGASGDPVYVDDVFSTFVYKGDGQNPRNINNGMDVSGEGGLVWVKARSLGEDHIWVDTERGATNRLWSNSTNAQVINGGTVKGFNNNGFQIDSNGYVNGSSGTYASWTFLKSPGFFDVVTYTGTGSARTIAHNLGSVPGMILIKATSQTHNWRVYHRSLGKDYYGTLNLTSAFGPESGTGYIIWNNTDPTSSVFSVGTAGTVNQNGVTYVAYIFAHDDQSFGTNSDESIIKCGTYAGSGSTDQTINLGFEPQWILVKNTSNPGGWQVFDVMRGLGAPYSGNSRELIASSTVVENAGTRIHPEANGFSFQGEASSRVNSSGDTFLYMAIRRPNKPPEVATEVFAVDTGNGSSIIPVFDSGFPVDFTLLKDASAIEDIQSFTRLTDKYHLVTNDNDAQSNAGTLFTFDSNVGWAANQYTSAYYSWMFKRAPGFMDVVTYTGTGSVATHAHKLTVVPELMIVKSRSHNENWAVYSSALGATKYVRLNTNAAANTANIFWNDTAPTSSVFTVYPYDGVNGSGKTYVNHLFATLPGISKVGSYTGTGNDINVDCGFTNGARFVLIKRTNSSGNWVLFDSLRGIVGGNDPYIKLNTTEAQKTDENHIAPLNAGFTVSSSSEGDTNANGGEYIFLAVA